MMKLNGVNLREAGTQGDEYDQNPLQEILNTLIKILFKADLIK